MTLEGVERALELVGLGEVQNAYSVLDRTHEDIVEFCREREIAFVPFFPLGRPSPVVPEAGRRPGSELGGQQAWGDSVPGRTGLAAGPL
ncbi:MAG: hypothetical protein WAL63_20215 [Solirubrobacteraceae bacterium]